MFIRVIYPNNKYDMVKDFILDKLIISGKITKFYRSSGWVTIGQDPIRGMGGNYRGPERRNNNRDLLLEPESS